MKNQDQISALLRLIDDPDTEVYDTVANELIQMGKPIISRLENLWEHTQDQDIQERIEWLIHRVHFEELQQDFFEWHQTDQPELLKGGILVARYGYPELDQENTLNEFDKIRRNIWMELNNYLTPLEQINIFNSILYSYYKIEGKEITENEPNHFYIHKLLESHKGNSYAIGILYLSLCEMLDIPIRTINIPKQFVFAYIDTLHHFQNVETGIKSIQFFIDPINGMIYTISDVEAYLKKIEAEEPLDFYLQPLSTKQVIAQLLEALAHTFQLKGEDKKREEILTLIELINE